MRRIVVIEGANQTGKTTAARILKHCLPGALVIEQHDCLHKQIVRMCNMTESIVDDRDWDNLKPNIVECAINYEKFRECEILELIKNCNRDDVIIERLCLTLCVYMELLLHVKDTEYLYSMYKSLDGIDAMLLFMTASPARLIERKAQKLTEAKIGLNIPFHLVNNDAIERKQLLYELQYTKVPLKKKHRIDTGELQPIELREIIEGLVEMM